MQEFYVAASSLGFSMTQEEAKAAFNEFDSDGSGLIDQEEFVRFCVSKALAGRKENHSLSNETDTSSIAPFLSAEQAQHGFCTAHLILDKNRQ